MVKEEQSGRASRTSGFSHVLRLTAKGLLEGGGVEEWEGDCGGERVWEGQQDREEEESVAECS